MICNEFVVLQTVNSAGSDISCVNDLPDILLNRTCHYSFPIHCPYLFYLLEGQQLYSVSDL